MATEPRLRVVLDTSIIVSATIQPLGIPAAIVSAGLDRKFLICYSDPIVEEYREVLLRGKFRFPRKAVDAFIADIKQRGAKFTPQRQLSLCPDPDDNKFLECAEVADAHYLVTGNRRHFPPSHKATRVVTPRQFITILLSLGMI